MAREKSIKAVTDKLQKALGRSFSPRQLRGVLVRTIVAIRKRTRAGYGVPKNLKPKKKLKPLSVEYIGYRKTFKGLDGTTSPTKSNLTLTGEMLRTLKVTTATKQSVRIGFSTQYAADKATWVSKARPWLNVSDKEFENLVDDLDDAISKSLKAQRL